MNKQQILINNYLGFLQSIERSHVITETDYLIEIISKEKLTNLTKKQLEFIEKTLVKFKINISSLKSKAKQQAYKLKAEFDKGKTPEEVSDKMMQHVSKEVKYALKKSKDKIKELSTTKKIVFGIIAFLIIFYVNTIISQLLLLVVSNPTTVVSIIALVVAPLVEETAKSFFIKKDMPWIGTSVVFGLEAIHYIAQLIFSGGAAIAKMAVVRLAALLMHFSTTYIQKKIIEKGEAEDKDRAFIAWTVGVGIHISWNAMALLINDKTTAWIVG